MTKRKIPSIAQAMNKQPKEVEGFKTRAVTSNAVDIQIAVLDNNTVVMQVGGAVLQIPMDQWYAMVRYVEKENANGN